MGCACGKEQVEIGGRKFYIEDCLGEGGFSYVFLVKEANSGGRLFALKRIQCHSDADQQFALKEVRIHEQLGNHVNVAGCETHCIDNGAKNLFSEVLLVLPYFKKGNLLDRLSSRRLSKTPFSEREILQIFSGICTGLLQFHRFKPDALSHRDLKVGNVMFDDDGNPVLIDFGSARRARVSVVNRKQAQEIQDDASINSTMTYRAPELFQVEVGSEITEKTDIWSLGCVLYALCFYKSPFDLVHEKGDSVALAVQSARIMIPEHSQYSDRLHSLILSLLHLQPSERPGVEQVLSEVEEMMQLHPQKALLPSYNNNMQTV